MSWLVWVRGLRGPSPQKVFDGAGDKPVLDSAIKDHVLSTHRLSDDEDALSLTELEQRYPAPALPVEAS